MAGATVDVRLSGDKRLLAAIDRLISRAQNLRPVYSDIAEYLLLSHDERWDKQESSDGKPWKPLSDSYKNSKRKKKSRGSDKILVLDTFLKSGLSYNASHKGLEFGTDKVYGATHQFGDSSRNIPARPFLGISQKDEVEILDIISDWLNK